MREAVSKAKCVVKTSTKQLKAHDNIHIYGWAVSVMAWWREEKGDLRRKSLKSSLKHLLSTFPHFIPPVASRREGIHPADAEGGQGWRAIRDSLHCSSIRQFSERNNASDVICCTTSTSLSRNSPFPQSELSRNSPFPQSELTAERERWCCGEAALPEVAVGALELFKTSWNLCWGAWNHPWGWFPSSPTVPWCAAIWVPGVNRVQPWMVVPFAYKDTEDFRSQFSPPAQAEVALNVLLERQKGPVLQHWITC